VSVSVEELEDSKYLDNVLDVAKKIIEFTIQINKKNISTDGMLNKRCMVTRRITGS
jgi:uncharacterized protein with HEPN domain